MASRMRVLTLNLHLTSDGCLVAVLERNWKGALPQDVVLQRVHIAEVNLNSPPAAVLQAVATLFALQADPESGIDPRD